MAPKRVIPSLAAIRVFEAAARHGSFTRAAEELGMTQAAASYQIKVLEERVGGPLFLRRPGHVELTDLGRRMAGPTTDAFDLLRNTYAPIGGEEEGILRISALETFSGQWLVRNLASFHEKHPEWVVQLHASDELVDFSRDDVDVAIRGGKGNWDGLKAHKVQEVSLTPMLSPQLAAKVGGLKEPVDLLKLPLLGVGDRWWPVWLAEAGVIDHDLESRPQNRFGPQILKASAAIAGQGVAMLSPSLYRRELEAGLLIQPFDTIVFADFACWLVYPEARRNTPKIRAFRQWLLDEVERSGLSAPSTTNGSL